MSMELEPTMMAPKSDRPETISSPESQPAPESGERKKLPEGYVAEKKRREEIKHLTTNALELDQEFVLIPGGEVSNRIEILETRETLSTGAELSRDVIGEAGINAITRRTYEGDPKRIAYVKPQSGETAFRYDADTDRVLKISKVFNEKTQQVDTQEEVYADGKNGDAEDQNLVAYFHTRMAEMPKMRERIAEAYGITPEEVPLSQTECSPRMGIDVRKSAIREYTTSQIDNLLNFGVVPQTVLRGEKGRTGAATEVNSVQEAFLAQNPDVPIRSIDPELYAELKTQGKNHPGAKSFMRVATMHWLRKALDGHNDNVLYDESTHQFKAIDNGLSQGLSQAVEKTDPKTGATKKIIEPLDPLRSVPLEIVQEHPDWELDEEALTEIKRVYESTVDYLKTREKIAHTRATREAEGISFDAGIIDQTALEELQKKQGGKEIKYITKLFRLQYENERIAEKEGVEFFKNLEYLITHKRPPQMNIGDKGGDLFPLTRILYRAPQPQSDAA
jgi:hypothetical protein